uniref:Putative secreted protein n=1 Tax=Ixodes ricinus TaxID=34613 RepID=A0A6B0UPJ9_IXORI
MSQYLARSSGDLLEELASLVMALLLMNLPQALSREATKPTSLPKAVSTRALYFRCTWSRVHTYSLGSWAAPSPRRSTADRPWAWMCSSSRQRSSPRPSRMRDTSWNMRPRSSFLSSLSRFLNSV